MNYRLLDKKPKRRGFGVTETFYALLIVLVLIGIGALFGKSIANGYYSLRRMVFPQSDMVVTTAAENSLITALQADNDQLKELLGRSTGNEQLTLAAVLVRPPHTPYDSIIIDAGSNMGLAVGDVIYAEMNYAIGRVAEVSAKTANVTLFSSSGQKEQVLIGSSTTAVSAEGRGGGNFFIKLPRNIVVNVGDPVIWPDIQTILLGSVDVVDSGSGDAYAQIYFKSPVNINNLRYVQFKSNTR